MKQVEPNALQQVLSQSQTAGVHPDADVLTAFAEGSLLARERTEVIAHLAVCAVCRETVSIAASLAPEPAGHGLHLVPRGADRTLRKWAPWLGIAAAVMIVSTAVLVHQRTSSPKPGGNEVAIVAPETPAPTPTPSAAPPQDVPSDHARPEGTASPAPARPVHREAAATPAPKPILVPLPPRAPSPNAVGLGRASAAAATPAASPSNPQQASNSAVNETVSVTNSSAQLETESAQATDEVVAADNALIADKKKSPRSAKSMAPFSAGAVGALAAPKAMARTVVRPQWRINEGGHPERSFGDGAWQPVLANESARMRVVSTVANDVWVGGEDQRLFHSTDNGTTWTAVVLPARGDNHHSITQIHFTSALAGTVGSDDGTTWTTADGGATWQ